MDYIKVSEALDLKVEFLRNAHIFVRDGLQITVLQLGKQLKGILLNSGAFQLQDILEHREQNYATLQTGKYRGNRSGKEESAN